MTDHLGDWEQEFRRRLQAATTAEPDVVEELAQHLEQRVYGGSVTTTRTISERSAA